MEIVKQIKNYSMLNVECCMFLMFIVFFVIVPNFSHFVFIPSFSQYRKNEYGTYTLLLSCYCLLSSTRSCIYNNNLELLFLILICYYSWFHAFFCFTYKHIHGNFNFNFNTVTPPWRKKNKSKVEFISATEWRMMEE